MKGNPLVLIIEDELPIRRLLRVTIQSWFRLQEAETGNEGLQMAVNDPPDLVILDLGLPDLDGQDVILRMREWSAAPIIVLSARDQEQRITQALDIGADDWRNTRGVAHNQ